MARSLIVVGAGPAGLAAACEAAVLGCHVTLIDEAARPGGQIFRQPHSALRIPELVEPTERQRKDALVARFQAIADRIDYRPRTVAFALHDGGELHVTDGETSEALRADAILIAAGVREVAPPFPGWTTPGVMYAGAAQSLLKAHAVLPGRRVVVAGAGPLPIVVAAQILRAGGEVAAIAPLHGPATALSDPLALWQGRGVVREGLRYLATVLQSRIPRLIGFVPVRAIGNERLEAVVLARIDASGQVSGTEREIACDALAMNYGFAANSELPAMAGADMRHHALTGGWLPVADALGRTTVANLFVAGDMAGLRGAQVAESEGRIVGAAAALDCRSAADLPASLAPAVAARQRYTRFQHAVRATLAVPPGLWRIADDATTICRCENVSLAELRFALAGGHRSPNEIKRATRIAMGFCGGRTCLPSVAAICHNEAPGAPAQMMTPRQPARPVPLAALARQAAR